MVDTINNPGTSETAPIPQPVIPLGYEQLGAHPLAFAVRGLGFICVVLGAFHLLVMDPLSVYVTFRQQNQFPRYSWNLVLTYFVPSVLISLGLSAFEVIAGIAAMRRRPVAIRALRVWAWCAIGYIALGSIANIWMQFSLAGGRFFFAGSRAYLICYVLERWLRSLVVPLVTLMLLRLPSVRNAFAVDPD